MCLLHKHNFHMIFFKDSLTFLQSYNSANDSYSNLLEMIPIPKINEF